MINLMIYISPEKEFGDINWSNETKVLPKIQIDNSLRLGWRVEDIMLVTNFDYEYRGVKALVISGEHFCDLSPTVSKINALIYLIKNVLEDKIYWFHDIDAFQLVPITEEEVIGVLDGCDMGLTDYGRTTINEFRDKRWSTGTIFFNLKALDIFEVLKFWCYFHKSNEEVALLDLLKKHRYAPIKSRIKRLNVTYNIGTRKRNIKECFEIADKPVRVLHFHPFDYRKLDLEGYNNLEVCLHGKNRMGKPLIPQELIKIFNKHGVI